MSETRFCKDCKHAQTMLSGAVNIFSACLRAESAAYNVVTGDPILPLCSDERASADRCGKDGKYFEAREA